MSASTRRPLIAGNWKMHKTIAEAEAFIAALLPRVESTSAWSARNGAQTATSTPSAEDTLGSRPWMNCSASAIVLCIFQLPAIKGVLLGASRPRS